MWYGGVLCVKMVYCVDRAMYNVLCVRVVYCVVSRSTVWYNGVMCLSVV